MLAITNATSDPKPSGNPPFCESFDTTRMLLDDFQQLGLPIFHCFGCFSNSPPLRVAWPRETKKDGQEKPTPWHIGRNRSVAVRKKLFDRFN
jgi:hypothetical protein